MIRLLLLLLLCLASSLSAQTVTAHRQPALTLPDATRFPGATNPSVTPSTIHQTICVSGWTKTIRPSVSYTNKLKATQMAGLGLPGVASDYEEDHLISLELGGNPTDPRNLWPQDWPDARLKDDWAEKPLSRAVCAGTMTLRAAQTAIATNWVAVYKFYKAAGHSCHACAYAPH